MGFCTKKCTSTARLDGKTVVITGANTGIGYETAMDLYKRGARVIMACRNMSKVEEAIKSIETKCADVENVGKLVKIELDLSSLQSIRDCAEKLLSNEERIDLLINNAGIMLVPEGKTMDGFEMQFGTNHLGPFLFTLLLLPKIRKSTPARIILLSSDAHAMTGKIHLDDLNWETRQYDSLKAYGHSKSANILFCKELAKRLKDENIEGINVYTLHPGVVQTELGRHIKGGIKQVLFEYGVGLFGKTPEEGAQTSIYCAIDEKCADETGLYYVDCAPKKPSKAARDDETAEKLWNESVKMVDLEGYNPFA